MIFLFFIFSLGAFADSTLDIQIRQFQIEALADPAPKREALYTAGAHLFHNKILSGNNNTACVSCHSPQGFTADGLPLGLGEGAEGFGRKRRQESGKILARHTPSLFNIGSERIPNYFWDARVRKDFRGWWITPEPAINGANPKLKDIAKTFDSLLSVQAVFPIANPDEMLGQGSPLTNIQAWELVLKKVLSDKKLSDLMKKAYPDVTVFNIAHIGNALAEFERQEFVANKTPWDLYIRGQKQYMNERMVRGAKLFIGKANCLFCHQGPHLTTFGTQNVGIPQLNEEDRGEETVNPAALTAFAFRIAPLRNVGVTAPYMHSGVFADLREVINHYNEPAASVRTYVWKETPPNYREEIKPYKEPGFQRDIIANLTGGLSPKLNLTPEEKEDLRCFIQVGLTDLSYQKHLKDDVPSCQPIILGRRKK